MSHSIDSTDHKIIDLLKENGRMPNTEIAKKVNLSEATVRNRLKHLIDEEYIQVVAITNQAKMGQGIAGNIKMKADIKKTDSIIEELKKIRELDYIALTTGAFEFEADFTVKDIIELNELITNKINRIDGIEFTESTIILQYIRDNYNWKDLRTSPNKP
ncbi:MAG: Lrp/AsnC family transcriptional regulator [Desulfobacterales bacterium]|nr:Lrp/AsnC family transcriptional regulator [Desulfobacterales bacterium]